MNEHMFSIGRRCTGIFGCMWFFWGRPGELVATAFSLVVMVGGAIAYWVLMSNFLFYTGVVIYGL